MDTLTVGNKLILHLFMNARNGDACIFPPELTSSGMSKKFRLGQTHIANELRKLAREGLVEVRWEYVAGARGKKKVYVPTQTGRVLGRTFLEESRNGRRTEAEGRGGLGQNPPLGGDDLCERDVSRVNTQFNQR